MKDINRFCAVETRFLRFNTENNYTEENNEVSNTLKICRPWDELHSNHR